MSVPDDFVPGIGANLVEASAGTGKTTWIVRTAVRLLLQEREMPSVAGPERLLAVTFTRAATAELKERIRVALSEVQRIRDGEPPSAQNEWMRSMLDAGGAALSQRLDSTIGSIDRLSVTTIHGFCKGALEEFALECGVPVGLQFIEHDRQYRDEAIADEWRALLWEQGPVGEFVMSERTSGESKRRNRWSPDELARAARVVRQGIGAERPERIDRVATLASVNHTLESVLEHWDEARLRGLHGQVKWNKDGITLEQLDELCVAMGNLRRKEQPVIAHIARWSRSSVAAVASKSDKNNKRLLPTEPFLDACEAVRTAYENAAALVWQDVVLSVAERMERSMERDRVAGFDEMIAYLQRAITSDTGGERLRQVLASRYDAVLVDEFQDTDWAQWTIFSSTFGVRPLVLVGDPKQSIYGFRGADITAYRAAHAIALAAGEGRVFPLDTNYRSDAALVAATEVLFRQHDQPFGVEKQVLDFEHVKAARPEPSLVDPSLRPMVLVDFEQDLSDEQERKVTDFVAAEVSRLLRDPDVRYRDPITGVLRRLAPSDVAILVSANRQAVPLLRALHERRVPAVSGATGDIAESSTWQDVMTVIAAIENPADPRVVRRALCTSLGGYSARRISALERDSVTWRKIVERLAEAQHDWTSFGFLSALMRLTNGWGARDGLAKYPDGERRLTDFRHVVSLLQEAEREGHRNPTMLLAWARRFAAESDRDAEYRQQHLESDDDAVTVSSMHVAKGLEWPVVLCAYLWKSRQDPQPIPRVAKFVDGTRRVVFEESVPNEIASDTPLAEGLRLSYVALTRARSRTYVIWAKIAKEGKGPIHHLLGQRADASGSPAGVLASEHPEIISRLSQADALSIPAFPEAGESGVGSSPLASRIAKVGATQTRSWTVSSYSRFTSGRQIAVDAAEVGSLDAGEVADEDSLRADQLPGGAHTGNALHELFERFDFTKASDSVVVDDAIEDILVRYALPNVGADATRRAEAADLVRRMLITTLSMPIPGGASALATVQTQKTLREWRFQLSMQQFSGERLSSVFAEHGAGWIAQSYAPNVALLGHGELDGFLTGIVDLVAEIDGKWWVVDWKSNTLGALAANYDASSCRQVMMHEHYILQYHLYVVALHRFLRSRLGANYDYERDFGGVGYAFLRGLAINAPSWFTDRPSRALVDALDECIGGYAK